MTDKKPFINASDKSRSTNSILPDEDSYKVGLYESEQGCGYKMRRYKWWILGVVLLIALALTLGLTLGLKHGDDPEPVPPTPPGPVPPDFYNPYSVNDAYTDDE